MTKRQKSILQYLSKRADGKWNCRIYPEYFQWRSGTVVTSFKQIAEALGSRRENVVRGLLLMEEKGILKVEKVRDGEGKTVKEVRRAGEGNHKWTTLRITIEEVQ